MKQHLHSLTLILTLAALPSLAGPAAPAQVEAPRSVFILPASPKEGRDPFFPDSMRPYQAAMAANHSGAISSLALIGISGPPDHRLVIINNHTFAVGDEGEVSTPAGNIRIICVEIKGHSAVVETGGVRQELKLQDEP